MGRTRAVGKPSTPPPSTGLPNISKVTPVDPRGGTSQFPIRGETSRDFSMVAGPRGCIGVVMRGQPLVASGEQPPLLDVGGAWMRSDSVRLLGGLIQGRPRPLQIRPFPLRAQLTTSVPGAKYSIVGEDVQVIGGDIQGNRWLCRTRSGDTWVAAANVAFR
jgi:hypothetical protein